MKHSAHSPYQPSLSHLSQAPGLPGLPALLSKPGLPALLSKQWHSSASFLCTIPAHLTAKPRLPSSQPTLPATWLQSLAWDASGTYRASSLSQAHGTPHPEPLVSSGQLLKQCKVPTPTSRKECNMCSNTFPWGSRRPYPGQLLCRVMCQSLYPSLLAFGVSLPPDKDPTGASGSPP